VKIGSLDHRALSHDKEVLRWQYYNRLS